MAGALSDAVKRYGSILALDHVDFEIRKGEILGLLGPNGAGKTTAIRALSGLIAVDSGAVELFGRPQHPGVLELKRRIGLVTQEITIFEDLSARENLSFFGGLYGLRGQELKERIAETIEFVGLTEHADRRARKYSGGMKRRLNVACALTHHPELLIMDEPTVGIDPQSRNHILESVRALRKKGTTILYTSHYMEEVQAIASRVLIMDQGHIIAAGTVDELVQRIQYEERVSLEVGQGTAAVVEDLRRIAGVKQVTRQESVLSIVSQAGAQNLDRIISCAQEAGGVRAIRTEKPTLEDVFLTLTGKRLRDGDANGGGA
ncbi:MAG: ABC transporter ATP-binding protein [Spirochaetales bacterium]|nr:ABC transporter ATP-binding protein [Spirochaetales bacterium]